MTSANKITIGRILLVPFFVVQVILFVGSGDDLHRLAALVCFGVAAVSDGLDGFIARRYHQRSELGAVLDPLADKLLLVSGVILLSLDTQGRLDRLPVWLSATIISRDVIILLGLGIIYYFVGRVRVQPHWLGKLATFLQMLTVLWVLLKWDSHWLGIWAAAAAACTGGSGIIYVRDGVRQLSVSPSSGPSPHQMAKRKRDELN